MTDSNNKSTQSSELKKVIISYLIKQCKIILFILLILPFLNSLFNSYFFTKYIGLTTTSILSNNLEAGKKYLLYIIGMIIWLQILRFIERRILGNFLAKMNNLLKEQTMLQFSKLKIENTNHNYDKVNGFAEKTLDTIQTIFFFVYKQICSIILTIVTFVTLDKLLGKIFIIFILVYFTILPFLVKKMIDKSRDLEQQQLANRLFIADINRNYFFERLFNLSSFTLDLFRKYILQENQLINNKYKTIAQQGLVANLLVEGACCILLFTTITSSMDGASKVAAITLIDKFFADMNAIPDTILPLVNNLNSIRENYQIFKEEIVTTKLPVEDKIFSIKLQNITYFSNEKKIFDNFSYTFTKGLYVITGESGKGKSTLLQILTGIRETTTGSIIYNDMYDTKTYSIVDSISYMTQMDGVYDRTVKDNIFIGNKKTSKEIDYYIKDLAMEDLMNQRAGVQGSNLSGGQIRRVTFLRMMNVYQEGNVFIFDEPFVALDKKLVDKVRKFILSLKEKNIVIIVDHMETFSSLEGTYINL